MTTEQDERIVAEAVANGGTHRDLVRLLLPEAADDLCDFLLWEQTPFPLVQGAALMPHLRAAVAAESES